VSAESPEVLAARSLTDDTASLLRRSPGFAKLPPARRAAILGDLETIQQALASSPAGPAPDPYAFALETPDDFRARLARARQGTPGGETGNGHTPAASPEPDPTQVPSPKVAATETIAARAGVLSDEINFPSFVAGLVHGTYDAIVDATIRQMEAFAELVSAVAKDVDEFTRDNVTPNQVRDWLAQQHPRELELVPPGPDNPQPRLRGRDGVDESPGWLADYGLADQSLSDDLIEEQLLPAARQRYGENRLRTLATMVLLGMSRVNVKDGTISARVRFRAAASDKAKVDYAVAQDPATGGTTWGQRGSGSFDQTSLMVSTVGVNVQADTELQVELFGEVRINFVSETLPLDRFVDPARLALLQRHSRSAPAATGGPPGLPATPPPATTLTPPPSAVSMPAPLPPPAGAAAPAAPQAGGWEEVSHAPRAR
jgi:hypothetical protein